MKVAFGQGASMPYWTRNDGNRKDAAQAIIETVIEEAKLKDSAFEEMAGPSKAYTMQNGRLQ